jgi:hypothetical protein
MYEDFTFNIFFPATGSVVELNRPGMRAGCAQSVTGQCVRLTPKCTVGNAAECRVNPPLSDQDKKRPGPYPTVLPD